MQYYQYKKYVIPGPLGTIKRFNFPIVDNDRIGMELATVGEVTYVAIPDDVEVSEQPIEIEAQPVTMTDTLRESIKVASPIEARIKQQVKDLIREKYTTEDEMYFARISVGTVMGIYTYLPGEAEAVIEYGQYVESIRQWAREERTKVGL